MGELVAKVRMSLDGSDITLALAEVQWLLGDWNSLAQLDVQHFKAHPDRAKLALLAAAGFLQAKNGAKAREYICLAQEWGANKQVTSQILVSGVHTSLGRAAALSYKDEHRAHQHFENAIEIAAPGGSKGLIVDTRVKRELSELGLLPGSHGRLQQQHALTQLTRKADGTAASQTTINQIATGNAQAFYIQLGRPKDGAFVPFLYIDSKSLPRSGLHYLKNTLSNLFGEHFSFCEWYQETGCCKQMPCALTGFASLAQETNQLRIRLIKSHDFDLNDPIYPTNHYLRRIVLVRDPLYILTSWFALDQLDKHKAILAKNGININKIWLSHEKEVLIPAFRLLSEHFVPPTQAQFTEWLEARSRYIVGFLEKWINHVAEQKENNVVVVHYEEVNKFIGELVREFACYLTESKREKILNAVGKLANSFKKREDPFSVPSKELSNFVSRNELIFIDFAEKIKEMRIYRTMTNMRNA